MSLVGSSAASSRIWAHSRLAISSSTWVPKKMIRSRSRRSKTESDKFRPIPELAVAPESAGVWIFGSVTVPTFDVPERFPGFSFNGLTVI